MHVFACEYVYVCVCACVDNYCHKTMLCSRSTVASWSLLALVFVRERVRGGVSAHTTERQRKEVKPTWCKAERDHTHNISLSYKHPLARALPCSRSRSHSRSRSRSCSCSRSRSCSRFCFRSALSLSLSLPLSLSHTHTKSSRQQRFCGHALES